MLFYARDRTPLEKVLQHMDVVVLGADTARNQQAGLEDL